jgi:hypothetical protein
VYYYFHQRFNTKWGVCEYSKRRIETWWKDRQIPTRTGEMGGDTEVPSERANERQRQRQREKGMRVRHRKLERNAMGMH